MQSSEKRKKMNIYDIAKEAGVSISTVSRVMNNKGNVNAATRKKVEAILDKHDYTPSAIARGMVSKTMKTVAVLTVDQFDFCWYFSTWRVDSSLDFRFNIFFDLLEKWRSIIHGN